ARAGWFAPAPSRWRHHESVCALTPVSAANYFAVSPLSRSRSTRFAQTSGVSLCMPTSGAQTYASEPPLSGTRFAERIQWRHEPGESGAATRAAGPMSLAIRWSHGAGENARRWHHEPGDWQRRLAYDE